MILGASLMAVFLHKTCPIIRTLRFQYKTEFLQKHRQGAQPEMKSQFKGHEDFSHQAKGEATGLSFALEHHLRRPRGIACYDVYDYDVPTGAFHGACRITDTC